jgi:hypothetical protein
VNLPPIAFGLPLMSALGRYLDSRSRPRSDTPQTPTHICTRTLLGPPLMSVLGRYSNSCSLPHSDSTRNPALVVLSIHLSEVLVCLTAIPYSRIPTPLGAPCLSALRVRTSVSQFVLQVRACTFGPRSDLRPRPRYSCIYKSEPAPSDPVRTSVIVRVTSAAQIRTAPNITPLDAACNAVLGLNWLAKTNPKINWATHSIVWTPIPDYKMVWLRAILTSKPINDPFVMEDNKDNIHPDPLKFVPPHYHNFADIF